jgi:hypothetical protein
MIGLLERGDCRDEAAQVAISSYLDGEADAEERQLAENHLEDCIVCQGRVIVWRQEARLIGSPRYTEGPTYQIQAEVRAALQPLITRSNRQPLRRSVTGVNLAGIMASLVVLSAFVFMVTRLNLTGPAVINTPISTAITMSGAGTATARVSGPVIMGNFAFAPTPTIALNTFNPPADLESALHTASAVRYYPAPEGRFAGFTAVLAWYADKSSRMWLLDQQHGETEVSLTELAETGGLVRFYYDDPQAVIWSERGAIVSYHLGDSQLNEWGLVVPQSGKVSAARLVQPATAAALAVKPTYSPVPRPQN